MPFKLMEFWRSTPSFLELTERVLGSHPYRIVSVSYLQQQQQENSEFIAHPQTESVGDNDAYTSSRASVTRTVMDGDVILMIIYLPALANCWRVAGGSLVSVPARR
jgi:hypothetical protein